MCTTNDDVELLVFEEGGVNPKFEDIAINVFADQVGVYMYPYRYTHSQRQNLTRQSTVKADWT